MAARATREATPVDAGPGPVRPSTLSIDVGGTGLKASVLDVNGKLLADRVRVPTTYPCPPNGLVDTLASLVAPLPACDRVSIGFPGVVRNGIVLTAPHFVTRSGPGTQVVKKLLTAWTGFDLADVMAERLGHPVRIANDADLQGLEVVSGWGWSSSSRSGPASARPSCSTGNSRRISSSPTIRSRRVATTTLASATLPCGR